MRSGVWLGGWFVIFGAMIVRDSKGYLVCNEVLLGESIGHVA